MIRRALVLAAVAAFVAPTAAPVAAADAVKVGVNLELSGPAAVFGTPQLQSIQMFVDDANAKGGVGGHKIELEVLDNKSDPTQSRLNITKLIDDGVVAVIGGGNTPTTMSSYPVAEQRHVPVVSDGASDAIVNPVAERHWVFKAPQGDSVNTPVTIDFFKRLKIEKIGFMNVNTAYGDSGRTSFLPEAQKAGIQVVVDDRFATTDTDMTAQLTKMRDAKIDAVVIWGNAPATVVIAKNAEQLGLKAKLIFSGGSANAPFTHNYRDTKNAYIMTPWITAVQDLPSGSAQRALLERYIREYEARYHAQADGISAYGGDAIRLIMHAMETSGFTRDQIRDGLERTRGFVSLSGTYNMSATDHCGLENGIVMAQNTGTEWKAVR